MLALVKFLHMVGLMLGGAASFGSLAIAMRVKGDAASPLNALRPVFGRMSLAAILLLWASGLWLYLGFHMGADLGAAFGLKLAAATAVLGLSVWLNVMGARSARTKTPPPAYAAQLRMALLVFLFAAVALAVFVFN